MFGDEIETGDLRPPEWLETLLRTAREDETRQRHIRSAAELARSVALMRDANQSRAFDRTRLRGRLESLAKAANANLDAVLRWFGLERVTVWDPPEALRDLGRTLCFSTYDLQLHLAAEEFLSRGDAIPATGCEPGENLTERILAKGRWDPATEERFRRLQAVLDAHDEPEP